MKRFHIHVSVAELDESIRFYSTMFAAPPSVRHAGIAWETFHTLGSIPVYGEDTPVFDHGESAVPCACAGRSRAGGAEEAK